VSPTTVLGVDGGGTTTHAIVADVSGRVLGAGVAGPSNWEDVGIEGTEKALQEAVQGALGKAAVRVTDVAASVFGLAGIDFPADEERLAQIPEAIGLRGPHLLLNDSLVALRAGTNRSWGIVVVAGTGSVVAGRNERGEVVRTFGMGPMFGDFGSASEISEAGITAVAAAVSGRGPRTSLTDILPKAAGFEDPLAFFEAVSRARVDGSTFAPQVFEAAEARDTVARGILEYAAGALAESAGHVARSLSIADKEFELVLAGSIFRAKGRVFRSAFDATIRKLLPLATPLRLEAPPVVGAALLAVEAAGVATNPALHTRLALASIQAMGHYRA
jgi:N-acetylglucosamine kinase-like BadF-type ATPase